MSEKVFATKFLRDEAQIKQDWLCLLMKDNNAPLDVTYKTNLLKIEREYYPIAFFDVTCEADWSATSYWEHVEEYQVAKEVTVYVDYQGKEHKDSGYDTEYIGNHGNVITKKHYRQPMSRTEYETKKKTVVDNIEQTSGYVDPKSFTEKVFTANSNCERDILGWMGHFNNSQLVEANDDYFKNYTVIPETVSRSSAQASAEKMARNDIGNVASRQVPGDRYEGLSVSSNILDVQRKTVYIGVYHIFYEYGGKNYNCLMCAGDKVDDVVLGDHPIDDAIKARSDSFQEEINKNGFFSRKTLFLIGAILLSLISLIAIPTMFLFSSVSGVNEFVGGQIVIDILISIALLGADAFCINKFIAMHKRKKRAESEKASFNESNAYLKKQIYDLIQNDSIPEEGKKETIEGWIKDQFGNYENSDSVRSQVDEENAAKVKKTMIIAGCGVAAVLTLSLLIGVIIPAVRYNTAIKKIENNEIYEGFTILQKMPKYKDASEYIKKFSSPEELISDEVFIRGLECVFYFSSDEFETEFGEGEKAAIEKDYGKKLAEVTIAEYAESLTDADVFKDNLKRIEDIKCNELDEENYIESVKGYYYLACDHAIAKYIEDSSSTKYFRAELQLNPTIRLEEDLKKVLDDYKEKYQQDYGFSILNTKELAEYGMASIIGAKYAPDSQIDVETVKYFAESKDTASEDNTIEDAENQTTKSAEINTSSARWYDMTELNSNAPDFYGIWCAAKKSKQEAIAIAKEMVSYGISGQVFYSSDWSNLSNEGWYVVSAGSYYTESDANSALSQVKEYYSDAYVKYSGNYLGGQSSNVYEEEADSEYYYVESLISLATTREITEADLDGFTSFELSAARNGIYAAHGYVFQTAQWNEFFSNFTWYSPDPTLQQGDVSSLENKNAATIRAYEEKTFGGIYSF